MMPTVSAPRVTEAVVMQPERLMGSEEWRLHSAWEESEDRARHTAKFVSCSSEVGLEVSSCVLEDEKTVKRYQ